MKSSAANTSVPAIKINRPLPRNGYTTAPGSVAKKFFGPADRTICTCTGTHSVPRPLPEPPRTSRGTKMPMDVLTRALEEWLAEIKLRYTIGYALCAVMAVVAGGLFIASQRLSGLDSTAEATAATA